MKSKFYLILLALSVLVMGIAGNALADGEWSNGGGDRLWSNPLNWAAGVLPVSGETTKIRNSGDGPIVGTGTTAVSGAIYCGDWGNTNSIDIIDGGSLSPSSHVTLGYGSNDVGTCNISGSGSVLAIGGGGDLIIARAGTGRINISDGGSVTIADDLFLGKNPGGTGYLTVDGGSIRVNDRTYVGENTSTGYITMNGGTFYAVNDYLYIGQNAAGYLTVNNDAVVDCSRLLIGNNSGSTGEVTINGGLIKVSNYLTIGQNGTGSLTINGGDTQIAGVLYVGNFGTGTLKINGGQITASGPMTIGRQNGGSGDVELAGGTISCDGLEMLWAMQPGEVRHAAMDITKGKLVLNGDARGRVEGYVNDGLISAYAGAGVVNTVFENDPCTTTVTASILKAWDPNPADESLLKVFSGVPAELSWKNCDPNTPVGEPNSVYVDVWFGTDTETWTKVVTAASGPDITSVEVTAPSGGTYVWRVDSYLYGNPALNSYEPLTGDLWTFGTTGDEPVVSVDAGPDMVTWENRSVDLFADVDDPGSPTVTTYAWSVDSAEGAALTEVPDDGDDSTSSVQAPVFTFVKPEGSEITFPVTFTITVVASDESYPEVTKTDTMTIDVYEDACKATLSKFPTADTDINADCVTDIKDLALMAAAWLSDYALTGPIDD